jgi:hypothetical protein
MVSAGDRVGPNIPEVSLNSAAELGGLDPELRAKMKDFKRSFQKC